MIVLGHIAYPTLTFMLLAKLLNIYYTSSDLMLLMIFSFLPDIDLLIHYVAKNGNTNEVPQHHNWFTHWPITYVPLIIALILYPHLKLFLITFGIYAHIMLDMVFSGDGIMFFYPFSKKYYNFLSEKTKNRHGPDWFSAYRKLPIYKIDIIAFVLLVAMLIT